MIIDLQLGASCKKPEDGDVYISNHREWAGTGYFTLVFNDPDSKTEPKLRAIPLVFAESLSVRDFKHKCSSTIPPEFIMPIGKVKLNKTK